MFEYLNTGAVLLIVLIGVPLYFIPKKKDWFLNTLILLCLVLLFIDAYEENSDANKRMQDFKNAKTIKCMSGGGPYSSADLYSVSQNEGWHLEHKYFIKESLMLKPNMCEEF